jgi:hypothetical protein
MGEKKSIPEIELAMSHKCTFLQMESTSLLGPPSPLQRINSTTVESMPALIKKKIKFFLIYKEIQSGAVAKSYMRKGFLIYEEMRKYFSIYE